MVRKLLLIPLLILSFMIPINVNAEPTFIEPVKIRCTCYTSNEGAITASGKVVREDIVAGKPEWLGCSCIMYENDDGNIGDVIGIYEFCDTGAGIDTDGDGLGDSIKNGKSIDVYRATLESCYDWINEHGDYVFIQVIPAVG